MTVRELNWGNANLFYMYSSLLAVGDYGRYELVPSFLYIEKLI